MKLVIHGKLDGLNNYISACRTNHYKGASMKAHNEKIVMSEIYRQMRGQHFRKPVFMKYTWYEANRRRDLDNVSSFGRKVIQDALVKTHVLDNDGWKQIKGFSDAFYVDSKNPRIEIEIEEVK